jgi:nucleotidyltransferase/DNA polymerase involved in DNA repair
LEQNRPQIEGSNQRSLVEIDQLATFIMNRTILHVDMDAFFAAVEQRDHPEYRNKPVIVGSDPKGGKGRGIVATCSYEARKFGVHSAQPISQAWRLCPGGIYVRGDMAK